MIKIRGSMSFNRKYCNSFLTLAMHFDVYPDKDTNREEVLYTVLHT
jgi:hypothetical protein